jgi:hypothetical protein
VETAEVMPSLRRLIVGFSRLRPEFDIRLRQVPFVVGEMALGHVYSGYFDFSPPILISPSVKYS